MMTVLAALWPWLIAIGIICAGIWFAHKPIDAVHGPAVMWPLPAVDAPDAEFEAWMQALDIGDGPAFDKTLAQIRELPEVAS